MKKFSITSITVGNFDGVHRGHQALIEAARRLAPEVIVLTFRPHPALVLSPERAPVRLLDYKEQEQVLLSLGVARVEVIAFTRDLAGTSGKEFFSQEILSRSPAAVVVGPNFRFGKKREAGIEELNQFCSSAGVVFQTLDPVLHDGRVISSTWIRECLRAGDFAKAEQLLGRPFEFSGRVIEGKKLGRTLGFPTANLALPEERRSQLPLSFGVYAGTAPGFGPFVMNIGLAPTVSADQTLKVEVHFLRSPESLYGQVLRVRPQIFLRPEKKFSSLEELKNQIKNDIIQAERLLSL